MENKSGTEKELQIQKAEEVLYKTSDCRQSPRHFAEDFSMKRG